MLNRLSLANWATVQQQLSNINPELTQLIDRLSIKRKLKFLFAHYQFGDPIEHQGQFFLPSEQKSPFKNDHISPKISQMLDYLWHGMPVAVVMSNTVETFIQLPSHIVPLRTWQAGDILSSAQLFTRKSFPLHGAYSVCAGTRSLFTLPKISHQLYNQRLQKYFDLKDANCPKTFHQQWSLFHQIAHADNFRQNWQTTLLFLPNTLIEDIEKNKHALPLRHYLLEQNWRQSQFTQFHGTYDLIWSLFINQFEHSHYQTHILETAKSIIKIALGILPGYAPCIDDSMAPTGELIDTLIDIYKIRYYWPVFMAPSYLSTKNPVYYALHKPTCHYALPNSTNSKRTINELQHIQDTIEAFKRHIQLNIFPFSLSNSMITKTLEVVEFDYFHPNHPNKDNANIEELLASDPRFNEYIDSKFPDHAQQKRQLPHASLFFHGCIRIRHQQKATNHGSMKTFLMPMRKKGFRP